MDPSSDRILTVIIKGIPAGTVRQHRNGELSFSYAADYRGTPLSVSMPLSNADYGDKVTRPYLFGILPDDQSVRASLGQEFGVSGNNPFALLAHLGLDCPGAVQFCVPGHEQRGFEDARYEPVADDDIEKRLLHLTESRRAAWQAPNEHWSLGGQQSKIALALFGDQWYSCEGSAATTHILKPGIPMMKHQALNEHLCLNLASLCGVPAAESRFRTFGEASAIVVRRYDRLVESDRRVLRFHQEDFCQACGVLPQHKYPSEGGVSARNVIELLRGNKNADQNVRAFTAQLFFNYLVGAPDAHGKNYSILFDLHDEPILAPLYDVASGLPYDSPRGGWRLAMGIGGENRFGRLRRSNLRRYADMAQLDESLAANLMGNLADAIIANLPVLEEEASCFDGGAELATRMVPPIRELCEGTLAKL